ncbi:hypothetical protein [Algibacter mikhailovii]|uniref:hypothetical protein n=1 Tax=Algibacter mikhailovii TaxID=425498 RepID=UPI002493EFB9|nr:hypothetical protein [Algibacter mikhailovii]
MNKSLILVLTLLPLIVLGQELKCCESIKEVETYLNGNWEKKDSDLNRLYHFEFRNGFGKFQMFEIKENGTLKLAEENPPDIKILATKNGFEIEYDYGVLKAFSGIKCLDSLKLTITRQDGAEKEYYRIAK